MKKRSEGRSKRWSDLLLKPALPHLVIADQAVQVDGGKGRPSGEVQPQHGHARHPEEEDVVTGLHHLRAGACPGKEAKELSCHYHSREG